MWKLHPVPIETAATAASALISLAAARPGQTPPLEKGRRSVGCSRETVEDDADLATSVRKIRAEWQFRVKSLSVWCKYYWNWLGMSPRNWISSLSPVPRQREGMFFSFIFIQESVIKDKTSPGLEEQKGSFSWRRKQRLAKTGMMTPGWEKDDVHIKHTWCEVKFHWKKRMWRFSLF